MTLQFISQVLDTHSHQERLRLRTWRTRLADLETREYCGTISEIWERKPDDIEAFTVCWSTDSVSHHGAERSCTALDLVSGETHGATKVSASHTTVSSA